MDREAGGHFAQLSAGIFASPAVRPPGERPDAQRRTGSPRSGVTVQGLIVRLHRSGRLGPGEVVAEGTLVSTSLSTDAARARADLADYAAAGVERVIVSTGADWESGYRLAADLRDTAVTA
jgi:hypothetical protein